MSYDLVSCEELVELATEYLEGALEPRERLRLERHLSICPPCRGFMAQMRKTAVVAGSAAPEPLSDERRRSLLEAYREWTVGR